MLHVNDLDLAFGGRQLFDGLCWHIKPGQRVGLVGPNGAGKTTLLRVIAGQQTYDAGTLAMASETTIGYLEQDVQEAGVVRTVLEETMQAFQEV
ncbi:MAG: ATP-binding cassette domain-containing protein, partial [Bacteroidota bacterium]